jgi:uncharacterized protein YdeI (YjbR/CyaY-like superfamily)
VADGESRQGLAVIQLADQGAWEEWLDANHRDSSGVWLRIAKKASGIETVSYEEALDVALAYGWIDGQRAGHDDRFYLQRFTARGPRSRWSRRNRDKATALIERGVMKAAGLEQVERARADGRWDAAYAGPRTATVPEDLERELDANPAAKEFFATLDSANRYAILYRVEEAKRPETRARRIEKFVAMLAAGEKIHP